MDGSIAVAASPMHTTETTKSATAISAIESVVRRDPGLFATPCYLNDPETVVGNYRALRAALRTKLIVSLKANSNADLLSRCFHAFTDGIEVASESELTTIAGRSKAPKFVNNPSMDAQFLRSALAARATIIVDSLHQADMLVSHVARLKPAPVILRLNGAVVRETRPGSPADHFGMDLAEAEEVAQRLRAADIGVAGCHVFAGSHSFGAASLSAIGNMARAAAAIESRLGYRLSMLNFGGGFAPGWAGNLDDIARYADALEPLRAQYDLFHESGRGIFGNAGVFMTRVVATKRLNGRHIAICDGGMAQSFLLCQTENMLRNLASPTIITADGREGDVAPVPVLFAGSTCSKSDIIGQAPPGSVLPRTGDLCLFENCGAYHSTYTVTNFLGAKPAKIYING